MASPGSVAIHLTVQEARVEDLCGGLLCRGDATRVARFLQETWPGCEIRYDPAMSLSSAILQDGEHRGWFRLRFGLEVR
jgi:hypothetical protein